MIFLFNFSIFYMVPQASYCYEIWLFSIFYNLTLEIKLI